MSLLSSALKEYVSESYPSWKVSVCHNHYNGREYVALTREYGQSCIEIYEDIQMVHMVICSTRKNTNYKHTRYTENGLIALIDNYITKMKY